MQTIHAPSTLEEAIRTGSVNSYMLSLYAQGFFQTGESVVVPKDRLRSFIRNAKNQLRGRVGRIDHHVDGGNYLVRFEAVGQLPAFERVIHSMNLAHHQ